MRIHGRVALLGLAIGLAVTFSVSAADEPAPLLKPVNAAGNNLRVRLPITPGFPKSMSFTGQIPSGKKKTQKSEMIDVNIALDTLPGKSYVTAPKLESWGYEVPRTKEFVLPELLIPAAQVAPKLGKAAKGHDATIKLTNIRLAVIDSPGSKDGTIYFNDFSLSATSLYQNNERAIEPRLSFGDKFLEMTVPGTLVKRPGTSDAPVPEVSASADETTQPAAAPTTLRGGLPVLAYACINGQEWYKTPGGKVVPVNVAVSSITNTNNGVVVTIGLARGCKIQMEGGDGMVATGVEAKSEFIPAKIKELRLGLYTGPGLKSPKDIVIKDLDVVVDRNQTEGYMLIGQKFMDTYFADAVYTVDASGWKLHGRVNPELLADIKTRPKQPKQ